MQDPKLIALSGPGIGDYPVPGFYEIKLVRKGPRIAARIVCEDGLWSALINGDRTGAPIEDPYQVKGIWKIYPYGRAITEEEYNYLIALKAWATKNDPSHPAANPLRPIDLTDLKPLWS